MVHPKGKPKCVFLISAKFSSNSVIDPSPTPNTSGALTVMI